MTVDDARDQLGKAVHQLQAGSTSCEDLQWSLHQLSAVASQFRPRPNWMADEINLVAEEAMITIYGIWETTMDLSGDHKTSNLKDPPATLSDHEPVTSSLEYTSRNLTRLRGALKSLRTLFLSIPSLDKDEAVPGPKSVKAFRQVTINRLGNHSRFTQEDKRSAWLAVSLLS